MNPSITEQHSLARTPLLAADATTSGVSWGAILAGAAGAAALSLILLILGVGLGLSSVSPWANNGASAGTLSVAAIIWLAFTQLAASGLGGYLAGRLRVKWASLHGDEVYFRDTAHGFLAWAIASLVTAAFLTGAVSSVIGGGVRGAGAAAQGAATVASAATATGAIAANSESVGYYVDSVFRPDAAASAPRAAVDPASRAEVAKIVVNDVRAGALPPEDKRYVGQLIAQQTGLSQADAEARVADAFNKVTAGINNAEVAARDAADKARKATAYSALWMFIALFAGAFFASVTALFGGRLRDQVH